MPSVQANIQVRIILDCGLKTFGAASYHRVARDSNFRFLPSAYGLARQMRVLHIPRPEDERGTIRVHGRDVASLPSSPTVRTHLDWGQTSDQLVALTPTTSFPITDHIYRSKALCYARERIWFCPVRLVIHEYRTSCIRTHPSSSDTPDASV